MSPAVDIRYDSSSGDDRDSRRARRRLCSVLAAVAMATAASSQVQAGGLFLPSRGVHATARGGAWIAGAHGAGALGINPAGLAADGLREVIIDASYVEHEGEYSRIDSNQNQQDPIANQAPGLPIPTFALLIPITEHITVAAGAYGPYTGLVEYPADGPQRYTIIDMNGSLAAVLDLSVAVRVNDSVRIGVGVQNLPMKLAARMAMSGCPGRPLCDPENPFFDIVGQVEQTSLLNPAASVGLQADLGQVRIGAMAQLPFHIGGKGTISARMGESAPLAGAEIATGIADVALTMPASVRVGMEIELAPGTTLELAASREMWSQTAEVAVGIEDLRAVGISGLADAFGLERLDIPLGFRDTTALMAGVEIMPLPGEPLTVLGGYAYESAAVPDEYVSVVTMDGRKHMITAGVGYEHGRYRVHALIGAVRVETRTVSPDEGGMTQGNPIGMALDRPPVYVNWGEYRSSWVMAGAALSTRF